MVDITMVGEDLEVPLADVPVGQYIEHSNGNFGIRSNAVSPYEEQPELIHIVNIKNGSSQWNAPDFPVTPLQAVRLTVAVDPEFA